MSVKQYKQVIDILSHPSEVVDWKDVAVNMAMNAPSQFLRAYEAAGGVVPDVPASMPAWMSEAKAMCAAGNKVGAIKHVRGATGKGLKEAKDFVEQELSNG